MKNGDAPAFHQATEWNPISDLRGLTKREYFAVMAMQGILAGRNEEIEKRGYQTSEVALWSIQQADELLKELES